MVNRLQHSTSPYLLQHKDNPVDWWEWGEGALPRRGSATSRSCSVSGTPRATGVTCQPLSVNLASERCRMFRFIGQGFGLNAELNAGSECRQAGSLPRGERPRPQPAQPDRRRCGFSRPTGGGWRDRRLDLRVRIGSDLPRRPHGRRGRRIRAESEHVARGVSPGSAGPY